MSERIIRNVTDVIDIEYLQTIQDGLGKIIGITTALLDPNGVPISRPTNLKAFCAMMQASEDGVAMCMVTNTKLIEDIKSSRKPAYRTCQNSGLRTAAVPIFLGNQFLGAWLIGQIRMDTIDYSLIEQTAERAGLSKDDAKKNIDLLPVISEAEFTHTLDFLTTITKALTDMVATNSTLNARNNELTSLTKKLDASLHTFREFIDLSDIGIYLVDYYSGKILLGNNLYRRMFGLSEEDDISKVSCFNLMGKPDFCSFCPKDKLLNARGEPVDPIVWERFNPPTQLWLRITSRALRWINGRMAIMTTFMDITDRKLEEERMAYLAYNDQRLGIPNAAKLDLDLTQDFCDDTYLICFDIKGLKEINNVYSRSIGDRLLQNVVNWVMDFSKDRYTLYRVSGDDFAIRIKNADVHTVMELASELFTRFEVAWRIPMDGIEQKIYTGVHMGVIKIKDTPDSYETLIDLFEKVIASARNCTRPVLFDEKRDEQYLEHTRLIVSLKSAVLNNMKGFSLNYQPVVNARTGKWVSVEVLCRWNSPELGFVPPDVFIEEAEQIGIIDSIGDWVFKEAISQVKAWELDKLPDFSMSINLSPLQLRDKDLLRKLLALLKEYDYPREKLTLEITETAQVPFDETTLTLLHEIRDAGISLSLDDFGTGYATFSNLHKLPVSVLKTDRSFITGIEEDEYLQHTMRIMVDFAHSAGLTVTAEGVETEEQLALLRDHVNSIQGYYFSRPLTKEMLGEKLDRFR